MNNFYTKEILQKLISLLIIMREKELLTMQNNSVYNNRLNYEQELTEIYEQLINLQNFIHEEETRRN
jgi:hypothetical protein